MDFYNIKERSPKKGVTEIYPDFKIGLFKDLMVRGKSFYAIWDEDNKIWSTNEYDVQRLVDKDLTEYKEKIEDARDGEVYIRAMANNSSNSWKEYKFHLSRLPDNYVPLDTKLTFLNTQIKKSDHVSKRLPYPLEKGLCPSYEKIIGTLFEAEERAKLEWAIGSIIAGDAKDIQKFIVLYGEGGKGKSTMLNIIQKLFEGYYTTFEAKALTLSSNTFSTEAFRSNPLVAIQHDGDLSRIDDNTRLSSIISHEEMTMNEKYKAMYTFKAICFLFIATNQPVKITDAKSGIIRRLIDVRTSGKIIPNEKYQILMSQIEFELGAIAFKCLQIYREMGKNYYSNYKPLDMMMQTNVFFNFVEENYLFFKEDDGVSLAQAYTMFKTYCSDSGLDNTKIPKYKFRDELKNYFKSYSNYKRVGDKQYRNYYSEFIATKFISGEPIVKEDAPSWLTLDSTKSIFDEVAADYAAQYANEKELPSKRWNDVKTKLSDLDTTKLHYVLVPLNHIVVDFDLKDSNGDKSVIRNVEAASKWPPTYGEYSKSQAGLHLHYIYDGDTERLSSIFEEGIEVKVFRKGPIGQSSLRRKLSRCNNIPIATINSGLPLKGEKVINFESVQSEKAIRTLIMRNLNKEIHAGTKPSIDFINTILNEAYESGMKYDVTDMRPKILAFANNSTNKADYCVKLVAKMKFKSEEPSVPAIDYSKDELVFFDVEVFPNVLVVSWKYQGPKNQCIHMINPTPKDIESLFKMKLVGFNCRRYDNHILYARYIGYDVNQVYTLSQRIVGDSRNGLFGEAYNISYTDIYDFSSIKQSLKKFQIDLGIHHQELGLPWDKPVPEDQWSKVIEYCDNDVISEEAVFNDRHEDFVARQILADLSGLTINDTTQMHTAKIIFGNDPKPQEKFVYTDLSEMFPGYTFADGKSSYRDEDPGEGGYVYSEPGFYENVALLDIASMHPSSIENLNLFGPYTKRYSEIKAARVAIKHKEIDFAKTLLDGAFSKYLTPESDPDALAYALKIILVSVYGFTSAKFANKFKDPRNIDNIVAKRGALFMIDLKHAVQEKNFKVVHIKTDSIKIVDADQKIIDFIFKFGKKYGYVFEHEATYDKFCLVNDAVYIAKYYGGKNDGKWNATGAQFAYPFVFKTLFSKEPIVFEDLCEIKSVTSALYLDMNENLGKDEHDYHFIGKTGSFCPIKSGCGGGILLRESDGKYNAATGTKGYRWMEAEVVKSLGKEGDIDYDYFRKLVDEAIEDISKFVNFEWFVSGESYLKE